MNLLLSVTARGLFQLVAGLERHLQVSPILLRDLGRDLPSLFGQPRDLFDALLGLNQSLLCDLFWTASKQNL